MLILSILLLCLQAPLIHTFTNYNFQKHVSNRHSIFALDPIYGANKESKYVKQMKTRRELLKEGRKIAQTSMIILSSTLGSKAFADVSTQEKKRGQKDCKEVSRWYKGNQNLWIVGTAHISSQSASLTSQIVRQVQVILSIITFIKCFAFTILNKQIMKMNGEIA